MIVDTALEHVTAEASQLWLMLDHILTDDWQSLPSLSAYLAPIARWMPLRSWRPLFHELGTHRLLAHRVNKGVVELSRWQDRFVRPLAGMEVEPSVLAALVADYSDWTVFTWDHWHDTLLSADIETEALWQLNATYIHCHAQDLLESRDAGQHVKITPRVVAWHNAREHA